MEEKMVWRVYFKYGYMDVAFDFESSEVAAEFIKTALTSFNKEVSYDKKDLYLSMSYVDAATPYED